MARYEDDKRGQAHYVPADAAKAVCGATTTGRGVYADEWPVPARLCDECLKVLSGMLV